MERFRKTVTGFIILFVGLAILACDSTENPISQQGSDETVDVVIVGAGLSGLSVAIELQEAYPEFKFVLLEQRDIVGGSSRISGATMGTKTKDPTAFNTNTTAELLNFYKTYFGEGNVNEALFNIVYNISEDVNNRLLDWGVTFTQTPVYPEFTEFNPPMYSYRPNTPDGKNGGGALSDFLASKIEEKSNALRRNSRATDLIVVNSKVIGVKVDTLDESYNIYAKAVILATGGFGSNRALVQEVANDFYKYIPITSYLDSFNPGATGDAFIWTKKLNVPLVGNDIFAFTMSLGNPALSSRFFVNQQGERYTNENSSWGYKTVHDSALQETYTYRIIDSSEVVTDDIETRVTNGTAYKFNTIADLAAGLEIDLTKLNETIDDYNTKLDAGQSPGFDLPADTIQRIRIPPFYADLICGSDFGTVRSIKIDNGGRVLNSTNTAVAGLYASVECTLGNVFPGGYYHGGLGMSIAAYTAVLAARTAAADLATVE
jgi:fumarate reductase flavoprotein subunit